MDNRNTRVLVVDDQESIYTDFQEMLGVNRRKNRADELAAGFLPETDDTNPVAELPSFELSYASNGDAAVEAVKSAKEYNRPFVRAYINIRMPPGIDGIEAIRQIRGSERRHHIPRRNRRYAHIKPSEVAAGAPRRSDSTCRRYG